jgi:hypothetical protein
MSNVVDVSIRQPVSGQRERDGHDPRGLPECPEAARLTRRTLIRRMGAGVVVLGLLAAGHESPLHATPAEAASWCQCVDYVKNAYGLSGAIGGSGGAKDMGSYLAARGFRQLYGPANLQAWAVAIFQPGFGSGINQTYGHVGLVAQYWYSGGGYWTVVLRGANQPGYTWIEKGCTNVSDWTLKVQVGSPYVSCWAR